MRWPLPVGLAAGADKDARAVGFFSRLPLGAVEVGTVTPRPQAGNPRPRVFRDPATRSLRNHLGFPGAGMERVAANLEAARRRGDARLPVGVNIGPNRDTTGRGAPGDYAALYRRLAPLADYLVLNVSSPNTPGLGRLQERGALEGVLGALEGPRRERPRPLFVKVAPGVGGRRLEGVVEAAARFRLAGLVATNTAPAPPPLSGGLSGGLLADLARETRARALAAAAGTGLEVVGSGGIGGLADLLEFWRLGGRVVQIYTALVFAGPPLLVEVMEGVLALMEERGVATLGDLIADVRAGGAGRAGRRPRPPQAP